MTDQRLEQALRDTFRSRESLVGDAGRFLPQIRERARRRRRARRLADAVAVTAVTLAVVVASLIVSASPPSRVTVALAGWRLESSLGVEIEVPATWAVNDFGCHMSARPSVVRGAGFAPLCRTPEPPGKEVAIIGGYVTLPGTTPGLASRRSITVSGVAAVRAEGRLPDGRYVGWVAIRSRDVTVTVRVRQRSVLTRILNSLHVVNVDHNGCATRRPRARVVAAGADGRIFVPADPVSVSVCYYGERYVGTGASSVLESSTRLTGTDARALATALNRARPGRNPDRPGTCAPVLPEPDAVLHVTGTGGQVAVVYATFSGCVGRGLDNGHRSAQITRAIVAEFMGPLRTGYGTDADLPAS